MLKEFMNTLVETAEQHCNLSSSISLKELPAEGGLYAEPGQGFEVAKYYDKTGIHTLPVLFLCRDKDQIKCIDQLESICNYFTRLKEYPKGEKFSWLDAEVAKGVSRVGRDADGVYHYSCILNCKLYF